MKKLADGYQVASKLIPEISEEVINQATAYAIRHRRLRADQQEQFKEKLRESLNTQVNQDKLDDKQYHDTRGVSAPSNVGETGVMLGGNLGVGAAMTAMTNRSAKRRNIAEKLPPPTIGKGLESMSPGSLLSRAFGPGAIIPTAAFETARIAMNPLSDPLYRRGQRSYLKSVGEGFRGQMDNMEEREKEVSDKYGLAGLPMQAFHGILNPITSLGYAGRSAKNFLLGKQGEALVTVAESAISKALEA